MSGIIGKKIGMTSIFDANGKNIPCTVIEAGPCVITQVKTTETDGYNALQIASIESGKEINKINKPQRKIFTQNKISPKKILKEFRVDHNNIIELGTKIGVTHFKK